MYLTVYLTGPDATWNDYCDLGSLVEKLPADIEWEVSE